MILYGAPKPAPNPRRVRMYLAEKGLAIPETLLDLRQREHKTDAFLALNSLGQVPLLVLDDGTTISETLAICRYFEALHPEPALFGASPAEQGRVEMWIRRMEFQIGQPVSMFWRHAHPLTAALIEQHRPFGESNRDLFERAGRWLDRELEGRAFLAGDAFTAADITGFCTFEFANWIGLAIPESCANLRAWRDRVAERPSAAA